MGLGAQDVRSLSPPSDTPAAALGVAEPTISKAASGISVIASGEDTTVPACAYADRSRLQKNRSPASAVAAEEPSSARHTGP